MTTGKLNSIKGRMERSTPGPWKWVNNSPYSEEAIVSTANVSEDNPYPEVVLRGECGQNQGFLYYERDEDMDFIANARDDVEYLLTLVGQLQQELEEGKVHENTTKEGLR